MPVRHERETEMVTRYEDWIGKEETIEQQIALLPVQALAATFDLAASLDEGDALPPGWQWLFFNPLVARSGLGEDGHPARGGFLPPIGLPRRMWAGSRIRYVEDVPIGVRAARTSVIRKVENKVGKRGSLWFVTVEHTLRVHGKTCIVEEQDIVYREANPAGAQPAQPVAYDRQGDWTQLVRPDTTLLFRFSALTFNGHRIHYDQTYAREVEGYPDLVVHGPLTAALLQQAALANSNGQLLSQFEFRGVSPLFVDRPFTLEGVSGEPGMALWARGPDGELAMSATATFRSS